jgi:hypothetical protein
VSPDLAAFDTLWWSIDSDVSRPARTDHKENCDHHPDDEVKTNSLTKLGRDRAGPTLRSICPVSPDLAAFDTLWWSIDSDVRQPLASVPGRAGQRAPIIKKIVTIIQTMR